MKNPNFKFIFAVLCLGYLIDYYDLSIFSVARPSILTDLGIPDSDRMSVSKLFFNAQALGIFVGGIVSGMWGDKIGRVSAIRAGIALYSCAILLNIASYNSRILRPKVIGALAHENNRSIPSSRILIGTRVCC